MNVELSKSSEILAKILWPTEAQVSLCFPPCSLLHHEGSQVHTGRCPASCTSSVTSSTPQLPDKQVPLGHPLGLGVYILATWFFLGGLNSRKRPTKSLKVDLGAVCKKGGRFIRVLSMHVPLVPWPPYFVEGDMARGGPE